MSPTDVPAAPHAMLAVFRIAADAFRTALPLPGWRSSDHVRQWLGRLSPAVWRLAARTVTTLDEACAAMLGKIVESDALWAATWEVLTNRLDHTAPGCDAGRILAEACAEADQNTGSTDPAVVLGLIESVVDLVKAIRGEAPPAAPVILDLDKDAPAAPETDDEGGGDETGPDDV